MPEKPVITLTIGVLVCALLIIMASTRTVEAANPANGSISPTGPNVVWQGPVTGRTWSQVTASDHFIHVSNISTGGTLRTANRNLIDYFQVSFDPTSAAIITYTDDHNDYDGHTYVTSQISGASINDEGTTNVSAPVEGVSLPRRPVPAADAPQVTDFAQDVQVGLLAVLPLNDPLDILSVQYACETTQVDQVIVAKMKVLD